MEVPAEVAKPASIRLEINPAVQARVSIDGDAVGRGSEMTLSGLTAGRALLLKIEAPGYETYEDHHTLAPGERLNLPIRLVRPVKKETPEEAKRRAEREAEREAKRAEARRAAADAKDQPAAAEQPTGKGKLSVVLKVGWGHVYIDGKLIEDTPLYNHTLKAGRHKVVVVNGTTGKKQRRTVTVVQGRTTKLSF